MIDRVRGAGPRIGKYRVLRRLAEGGMGEIFLAQSVGRSGFEKVVVLKRILRHNMSDRDAVRMFMDEARLMAALNHPNVVQVYDFGTAAGAHFFTMEYVHGQDLGRIMKKAGLEGPPLPFEFGVGAIVEAAAGLHYAHEKRGADGASLQIVHRDISPSNVLVSYDGAVKVADFGIAKWRKRETETRHGTIKGKIAYLSPEQCRGDKLDSRSDVFGLGILLFELTTGTRLFQGTSDFGILEQIVNQDAPKPSSRRPDYPPAIERIVLRALARDPDKRYPSARELQVDLEDHAREERMKISAVNRAEEMSRRYGEAIEAWREAEQAGRSLLEHLAAPATVTELGGGEPTEIISARSAALPRPWFWAIGVAGVVLVGVMVARTLSARDLTPAVIQGSPATATLPRPTQTRPALPPPVAQPAQEPIVTEETPPTVFPAEVSPRARRKKARLPDAPVFGTPTQAANPPDSPKPPASKTIWDPDSVFLP